ncbi:hypothetical protein PR202_ga02390 [Eleusine coracana subsp. coracana]|uniref:AAA+ ATPase domain-containing protein n=1 Tax=Eleusine coracana subsp. coracana TaxID=191504 RepID=A0AAV5BLL6_ELECO|nr:hypothetical protein PR202_ga02390 [Eleusine coracana subsp. coracana]
MAAAAAKAAAAAISAGATAVLCSERAHAEGGATFRFPGFSSPAPPPAAAPPAAAPQPSPAPADKRRYEEEASKVSNQYARTTAPGFDPAPLERGLEALRELNKAQNPKKLFELMYKQEETRQQEIAAKKLEDQKALAQFELEKKQIDYEERKKMASQNAQIKSQILKYEDELARKRMQAEHEAQRARNQELVKMQEESGIRLENIRRRIEEEIQAQRRKTEEEIANIDRETTRQKAFAEAEAKALEKKASLEVTRRLLIDQLTADREKWVQVINTTFDHIGGQPSLIRESSRGKYPWSGSFSRAMSTMTSKLKNGSNPGNNGNGFGDVILNPSLQKRVKQLANATANTKLHQAPFRNMLFYGPPGTGKTMAARELARKSGLDYALMTGGDVAPLGSQAVTKIHQLFDWAKKSNRGLLLFIDEADAFLCERNKTYMSEAQRSALNALLFRTGDQSKDIVLALATNRPGDLDSAVADRIDEVLEFPLPGEDERFKLLKLYLDKYIVKAGKKHEKSWLRFFRRQPQKIEVKGITEDLIQEAAAKTQGFSGREIAKLMASVQAAVYGSKDCELTPALFREVVDYKVAEHQQRRKLAGDE